MPPYLNLLIFFALCHFSKLPACRVLDDLYSFVANCCNMCFWFILKRALDITSWTGCNMAIGSPIFRYPYCFIYLSFFSWTNIFFSVNPYIFLQKVYQLNPPSYDFIKSHHHMTSHALWKVILLLYFRRAIDILFQYYHLQLQFYVLMLVSANLSLHLLSGLVPPPISLDPWEFP